MAPVAYTGAVSLPRAVVEDISDDEGAAPGAISPISDISDSDEAPRRHAPRLPAEPPRGRWEQPPYPQEQRATHGTRV